MSNEKRFLVIGAGTMGGAYARMLAGGRVPGATLAGVVDVDGARALQLGGATGAPAFGDIANALADTKPDAAYVATPDALHRKPVQQLAEAGVAILVEKPLATTTEDALAMVDAVRTAGVYAEVNYSNRWNPPFVEASRTVDSGELGDILSFNVRLNNPIGSPRTRLNWSGGTTPAWFLMSHCLDLALWLGKDRAAKVYASGGHGELTGHGIDTPDWVHATVKYEHGGDGVFESLWILPDSWPGGAEFNFRAVGTKGALDVDTGFQNISVVTDRQRYPGTLNWAPQRLAAFVRSMDGQGRTRVTFDEGLEVTKILVAIHKSLESGNVEPV